MRKYAFIWDNTVVKVDMLDDEGYVAQIHQYQTILDITDQFPEPVVGWGLRGSMLAPPAPVVIDPVEYVKRFVYRPAKAFCAQLEEDFVSENIALGITQAGRTKAVTEALEPVLMNLRNGSLYEVLAEIEKVTYDPELVPFITEARVRTMKNKVRVYLGFPEV